MKSDVSDARRAYVYCRGADWREARALHLTSACRAASLRSRSVTAGAERMEARA
jgi:hypothetical protein